MSLSAVDAEDRALQLIDLTAQLTERLAAETRAFEAHRPQDAAAGSAETQRLANLYRHEATRVKREPVLIAGAAPATRAKLMRATEAFDAVLARHGRAVAAARTISEGIVQAIAKEVAAVRSSTSAYGPGARPGVGDASAIALNRRA
jgi:hypothetical protein